MSAAGKIMWTTQEKRAAVWKGASMTQWCREERVSTRPVAPRRLLPNRGVMPLRRCARLKCVKGSSEMKWLLPVRLALQMNDVNLHPFSTGAGGVVWRPPTVNCSGRVPA